MSDNDQHLKQILEAHRPVREKCITDILSLDLQDVDTSSKELVEIQQKWEELGVVLDQEKGLDEQFKEAFKGAETELQHNDRKAKDLDLLAHQLIRALEKPAEGQVWDEPSLKEINEKWASLELPLDSDLHRRFEKAFDKAKQIGLKQTLDIKIQQFKDACDTLESLKQNSEMKFSERQSTFMKTRDKVKELALHSGPGVPALRDRFNTLQQELNQELGWERWSGSKRKEDLVTKAVALAENPDFEGNLREELLKLQAEWKEIGFTSKEDDSLWEKFKLHGDTIYAKVVEIQTANEKRREELLAQLEPLTSSSSWKETHEKIKTIQEEWKKLSEVSKKSLRKQGDRYRKFCDKFFDRRREHFKQFKEDQKDNLKKKEVLVEQAKKLHSENNWRFSLPKVKDLQAEWKKTGPVPKKQSDAIWKEFQEACNVIYDKRKAEDQVRDVEFEGNLKVKLEVLESMEALAEESDLQAARNKFNSLEKQYRDAGKVPRKDQRSTEDRFRKIQNVLNEKEQEAQREKQNQLQAASKIKAGLCENLETFLFEESWDGNSEDVLKIRDAWEVAGPSSLDKDLKNRYRQALQWLERDAEDSLKNSIKKEAEGNQKKMESLVLKLEQLAGVESGKTSAEAMRQMMVAELQAKMGKGKVFKNKKEEAEGLLKDIQSIGILAPAERETLNGRIEAALTKIS
jgi:hypothetical protein